jgi:hypothetical protein
MLVSIVSDSYQLQYYLDINQLHITCNHIKTYRISHVSYYPN